MSIQHTHCSYTARTHHTLTHTHTHTYLPLPTLSMPKSYIHNLQIHEKQLYFCAQIHALCTPVDTLIHTFSTFGCICTHLLICVYTHVDSVWVFDNGCIHSHLWIWLHKSIHQAHTYLLLTVHAMLCCSSFFQFPSTWTKLVVHVQISERFGWVAKVSASSGNSRKLVEGRNKETL